jgi:integrase/recombinase XerD
VTHLRQKMLDELQRRNYSQNTICTYLHAVEDFSKHFHRSPDRLGTKPAFQSEMHQTQSGTTP